MYLKPTKEGHRRIRFNSDFGDALIEVYCDHDGPVYDADGNEVAHLKMVMKTPKPSPELLALARQRHDACAACPAHADLTDTTVTCRRRAKCRGCYNLLNPSLRCPDGLWPDAVADLDAATKKPVSPKNA